jgi:hypothetical protein
MPLPRQASLTQQRGDEFAWKEGVANLTTDQIAEAWFTVRLKNSKKSATDDSDPGVITQVSLNGEDGVPVGITLVDSTTVLVQVAAAQTALWMKLTYDFDLAIRTLAGKEYTLTDGTLSVNPDVTKRR